MYYGLVTTIQESNIDHKLVHISFFVSIQQVKAQEEKEMTSNSSLTL